MTNPNVLFLCTGNSCRSQMSEALLRARAGDRFNAYSAGTQPKGVHPFTKLVLEEQGIDTSTLRSKNVSEFLGTLTVDYLIVVCGEAEQSCPGVFAGMQHREFWPFADPPSFPGTEAQRQAKFREVRDQIDSRIRQWLASMEEST